MVQVDVIARAIDWLDACKSNEWRRVVDFYAPEATIALPSVAVRSPTRKLAGIEEIKAYWVELFAQPDRAAFELVEFYPGHDSAILIYYDRTFQRICEFLQFDADGFITMTARHLVPMRRSQTVSGAVGKPVEPRASHSVVLTCEARQSLGEARRLPVGSARNALRQRAHALRALAQRSVGAGG